MKFFSSLYCALLFLGAAPRASLGQSEAPPTASPLSFRGVARLVTIARRTKIYQAKAVYPRFLVATPVTRLAKSLDTALLSNFVAEKDGLRWFFAPYAVGPYSSGEFEVKLSLAELGSDFNRAMLQGP